LHAQFGKDFKEISKHIPGRGQEDCRSRYTKPSPLRLQSTKYGWFRALTRWIRHLDPAVNKLPFTIHEDRRMLELHALLGNRWTAIAKRLNTNRVGVDVQRRVSVLKRNGARVPPPNPKDLEDAVLMEELAHSPRGPARPNGLVDGAAAAMGMIPGAYPMLMGFPRDGLVMMAPPPGQYFDKEEAEDENGGDDEIVEENIPDSLMEQKLLTTQSVTSSTMGMKTRLTTRQEPKVKSDEQHPDMSKDTSELAVANLLLTEVQ